VLSLGHVVPWVIPSRRALAYLSFLAGPVERHMMDLSARRLVRHRHWPEG
jgi:Ni,Fe-hydrogenase III component G